MASVKIPYYRVKRGKGFFQPTKTMREAGFQAQPLGDDGPDAWSRAWSLYEDWQRYRRGEAVPPEQRYLIGSVGEAFQRYRKTEAWTGKALGTRREWEYAWTWIEQDFVDVDPNTIELEMVEDLRKRVRDTVSPHAAHKIVKVWRALWAVMASLRYCRAGDDPSFGLRNSQPKGRSETFTEGEAVRLAKRAWRMKLYGLAAIIAVIWDTQFSPGDARTLLGGQQREDKTGRFYETKRGKTGRDAIGTVSTRTARVTDAYLGRLGVDIHDDAPIFRDVRGNPYTMFSLARDFRLVRKAELGNEEKRRLMDMRRSGAVEANAGEVDPLALADKMANSIDSSGKLQDTYLPRRVAVVRRADAARQRGRQALRENE